MNCVICRQAELQEGKGTSIFERNGMTLVIKKDLCHVHLNRA